MRRFPIVAIAVLLLLPCCKWAFQQIVETVRYVSRWADGTTRKEGTLADGLQTGRWVFYYQDGRKRAEGGYADDVQVGAWTYYYESGNTEWVGEFDDTGKRTSLWTYYHDNGSRRAAGAFRDDREQGYWRFWDKDGRPTQHGCFDDGRRSGLWTSWHPDGRTKAEGLMLDGVRVGTWRLWNQAGEESAAQNPMPQGVELVRETRPDGGVRRLGLLRGGEPAGSWTSYHDDGSVRLRADVGGGREVRCFAAFAAGGTLLADGSLRGADLDAWRTWSGEVPQPQDRIPLPQLPPTAGDEWSPADLATTAPAAQVVATWLAELRAPAAPAAAPEPAAPIAAPEQVAAAVTESPRLPASKQPAWTVLEDEELQGYVQQYLEGRPPERKPRKRYEVPKAMQGTPRRREDLEGNPFPVDTFEATDGSVLKLSDLRGKKRVLVVILRGFSGQVCVYCVAQTEALAQCYDTFEELDLEVLVVYPGPEGNEKAFLQAYEETFGKGPPPYRVYYDPDLALVKQLGIEGGDLAYPTTILVDEQGVVRYAYTGATRADRPAAKALIEFIRSLKS